MTNDELVALGVWVLESVGEGAISYAELDALAVAAGIVEPGRSLTRTPEFAKIKEAFLEHHAVH
jgi:stage V sporulation protein SpoVS